MGMYTEIYVNVDLKKDTPKDIISVLQKICSFESLGEEYPYRWSYLFGDGSYYTPNTQVASVTYDSFSKRWSLLGKGDIKNYGGEIEKFFRWIAPYVDNEFEDVFMGYWRYEEDVLPTLVLLKEDGTLEYKDAK